MRAIMHSTGSCVEKNVNVNDRLTSEITDEVSFGRRDPTFTSLPTDEASVVKYLA